MSDDDQRDLFRQRVRSTDPDTSRTWAALRTGPEMKRAMLVVGDALHRAGPEGLTTLEMVPRTGMTRVSVSPLLKPMERLGLVMRTDRKRNRGIVWILPEFDSYQ